MTSISTTAQLIPHIPLPQIDTTNALSFFPDCSKIYKLTLKVVAVSGIVLGVTLAIAAPTALATYSFTILSHTTFPLLDSMTAHWLTALKTLLSVTGRLLGESRPNDGLVPIIFSLVPLTLMGALLLVPALPFVAAAAPGIYLAQYSKRGYDLIDGISTTEESNSKLPPFSTILSGKIVTWGNFFIDRKLYSKENISTFYGTDYVAVFNNALFSSIYDSFTVVSETLTAKQTSKPVTGRDLSPTIFKYCPVFTTILQQYEGLTSEGKEALKWHLCCDGEILNEKLISERAPDFDKIRKIMASIGNIRIELVEHGIVRNEMDTLNAAFEKLRE